MKPQKISYKTYSVTLLAVIAVVAISSSIIRLNLQKLSGELTRLGFYPESDFGWSGEQYHYQPPLKEMGVLNEPYDIVVIGDSFSTHPSGKLLSSEVFYPNALVKNTALRVGVFHIKHQPVLELLKNLSEQDTPPTTIIYQTVERSMKSRLSHHPVCPDKLYQPTLNNDRIDHKEPAFNLVGFSQDTNTGISDFGYAGKYLFAQLTGHKLNRRVIRSRLSSNDLFSNKKSDQALFLDGDFAKSSWSIRDWEIMKCSALHMQNIVQKNGKSKFVFMVSPDKSTIYESYVTDREMPPSRLALLESEGFNFLRLDQLLSKYVEDGSVDLYLPNSTHWSYEGHEIVAMEIIKYLNLPD